MLITWEGLQCGGVPVHERLLGVQYVFNIRSRYPGNLKDDAD
jgi:hypothetical protein